MQLLLIGLIYCFLSFIMQKIINRLPIFCSLFWPFIATWGILWTVAPYSLYAPLLWPEDTELWHHALRLAFIFSMALPGQYIAYRNQMTILIEIFRRFKINRQTTGYTIYFHEMDSYRDKFSHELKQQDSTLNDSDNIDCFNSRSIEVARKMASRYRRRYPA